MGVAMVLACAGVVLA
jgi:hypothetical protein